MKNHSQNIALELRSSLDQHNKDEKHIGYHILPERLNTLITSPENRNKYTFYEPERLRFFLDNVDFKNKCVLDIGCNIGYFLFSFLDSGAKKVVGYEGKGSCADFLKNAILLTGEEERFEFHNEYFEFDSLSGKFDVILLLNVLHHLGDDYGDQCLDINAAMHMMLDQLNKLSHHTTTLIFQMGFNWKGNRDVCLFENGTKTEMINFIEEGTKDYWDISTIGIPHRSADGIEYAPVSASNIQRDDSLGEFLNRPIFILQSRV